jgi:twitching motility protein PilT
VNPAFAHFEQLLAGMTQRGASDLFFSEGKKPAYRVDGGLRPADDTTSTHEMLGAVLEGTLRPPQRETFERTGEVNVGLSLDGVGRFRLNVHLQRGRTGIVVRRVPTGAVSFAELGLPDELRAFSELRNGLVLVTGATGSGKSTTLAAMVHHLNSHFTRHIVTIEDPVEFVHEDLRSLLTQREVGSDTPDFPSALHNVLRESPDVILIGEMRDPETASVALSAALTGHLVLTSLHTTDAIQAINRFLGLFPEQLRGTAAQDLAVCLRGVIAQRLVPRADRRGRVAAVERLTNTPAVQRLLREGRQSEIPELMRSSEAMCTFNDSLLALIKKGDIDLETGQAYSPNPEDLRMHAQGMERGSSVLETEADALPTIGGLDMRSLLHSATRHGASDIHLTVGCAPVFRINGELSPLAAKPLTAGDVRALLFTLLSHAQREQFELEKELDFAISLTGNVRFRVNAHYQRGTVAVAMRVIPSAVPERESLGLPEAVLRLAGHPQGLVLVTGPTGSGKSTTLATLVDIINSTRNCKIITVEDPIEFIHPNRLAHIEQREVGTDTKSFSSALKYILRQDPDVVLVGEMRDLETIQAALTAAETGHLVLATLHTNDAPQAVDRIIDVFPAHQQEQIRTQLASALLAVISQRLLPARLGGGRVAAFEILMATAAVRTLVREGKTHQLLSAMEIGSRDGMVTMDHSLQNLLGAGKITREEALRYVRTTSSLPQEPAQDVSAKP